MLLFLNVIYVLIAIAMIALILMQRGAGAQAGSGFGARRLGHRVRFARRFELPVEVDQVAGDRVLRDQPVHGLAGHAHMRAAPRPRRAGPRRDGGGAGGSGRAATGSAAVPAAPSAAPAAPASTVPAAPTQQLRPTGAGAGAAAAGNRAPPQPLPAAKRNAVPLDLPARHGSPGADQRLTEAVSAGIGGVAVGTANVSMPRWRNW